MNKGNLHKYITHNCKNMLLNCPFGIQLSWLWDFGHYFFLQRFWPLMFFPFVIRQPPSNFLQNLRWCVIIYVAVIAKQIRPLVWERTKFTTHVSNFLAFLSLNFKKKYISATKIECHVNNWLHLNLNFEKSWEGDCHVIKRKS